MCSFSEESTWFLYTFERGRRDYSYSGVWNTTTALGELASWQSTGKESVMVDQSQVCCMAHKSICVSVPGKLLQGENNALRAFQLNASPGMSAR